MSLDRTSKQWMQMLARLRARAARLRERPHPDRPEAELLDEALALADAMRIECANVQQRCVQLEAHLQVRADESRQLIDLLPCALIATDGAGQIEDANRAATALFGVSRAKLKDVLLMHFSEDRPAFAELIRRLPREGQITRAWARIRPRDRAPFDAQIALLQDPRDGGERWLWMFDPVSAPRSSGRTQIPAESAVSLSATSAN